ncbi:MAG: LamG domain-containing protein [Bacteroidales bacterium]|jgi:hypothetical protein|nr:LamG domain-containing protein [Bacteroidales bacterium]
MNRRRAMMGASGSGSGIQPIFHVPLTSDGIDIINGIQPSEGNTGGFSSEGALFSTILQYLRYLNLPISFSAVQPFSIEYDIKNTYSNPHGGHQLAWEFGTHSSNQCLFWYSPRANLREWSLAGANWQFLQVFAMPGEINLTNWRHECITYDGNGIFTLYLNGVLFSSASVSFPPLSPNNALNIGAGKVNADNFNGYIKDLKIYNDVIY